MPGMFDAMAADFDGKIARERRQAQEQERLDAARRDEEARYARAAWARLLGVLRGERPTREPTRPVPPMPPARGMLPVDPTPVPNPQPRRGPYPPPGGVRG